VVDTLDLIHASAPGECTGPRWSQGGARPARLGPHPRLGTVWGRTEPTWEPWGPGHRCIRALTP